MIAHILATTVTDGLSLLGLLHQQVETILTLDESILTKYVKTLGVQEVCNQRVFV